MDIEAITLLTLQHKKTEINQLHSHTWPQIIVAKDHAKKKPHYYCISSQSHAVDVRAFQCFIWY